jgi:hypothetical protein
VAAAEFAEILKYSPWTRDLTLDDVARLIDDVARDGWNEEVAEFDRLVAQATRLQDDRAEYRR